MRRRRLVILAAMLSSSALLLSYPKQADAAKVCAPSDSTCQTYCPFDLIAFCNYTFRFTHCTTKEASCDDDGLCPDSDPNTHCCNVNTGTGCDGINRYCATEHITCYFY
jgi:hypothetical protein